jgi:hypothetical protein
MKKNYPAIVISVLFIFFAGNAFGQHPLVTDVKKQALVSLSAKGHNQYSGSHIKALSLAKAKGWVIRRISKNGGVLSLQGVNMFGLPVYLKTNDNGNVVSAATTQTTAVQPGGSLGLNFDGSSGFLANKLAIWDAGAVYAAHQEFTGKTITSNTTQPISDHSTHVSGTMIAQGIYAPAKGMAFNATTLQSYDFDDDITTISTAAPNLLLSNHSYGDEAGWDVSDDGTWTWYGLPGDTVDYTFGTYNQRTQAFDQIANSAPYYLIVESAGNARGYSGPAIGSTYLGYKSKTDGTLVTKTRTSASNISSQLWYDGIASTGNAKDILTVAAVGPLPYGPANTQSTAIASFSSWGPSDDGRVKPDISGMGVNVLSCGVTSPQAYLVLSGTSMAAPNVTGSLYLLQEYYAKKYAGNFMLSATLKGLVCHTAVDAGNAGPDYIYGWGLLDTKAAAQAITDNGTKSLIKENSLKQGQPQTVKVTASGDGPLMATIAWNDPAAAPTPDGMVNDRTIKLVNDLDIRISDSTTTFLPWVLNPLSPAAAATKGDNIRDNVEQVQVLNAVPGRTYTITISNKNNLQGGFQDYSLIVTGIGGTAYCTSGPLSSADSRINNVTLANINNTPPDGCTTYSDYTGLTAQLEVGKTYPLSLTLGTCGNNFNKVAKVYIDWNGDGSFDGPGELVATTPVINNTAVYNTNITIPGTVTTGNYSLMRIVLEETSDTAAVKPCGAYGKGETQDYRVQFLQTAIDAGVSAIVSPDTTGSCAGAEPVSVTLKNYGSQGISNIPVMVTIKAPDNSVTTIKETYTDTIPPLGQDNFTLNQTYDFKAGESYSITGTSSLAKDLVTANNEASSAITINTAPTISGLNANYCDEESAYILSGNGDGNLFWYANDADKLPLTYGLIANTSQTPVNNTYYAGLNDFSGTAGPATKTAFTGGGYNQFDPGVNVHTQVPVIIKSARLYIGYSGKITFSVTNTNGQTLSSTTIDAIATRTTPAQGAQANDPSDTGKVYTLNLLLPAAGDYVINVSYDNTATIYRSDAGVSGYPFTIGNIFSITGNGVTTTDPPPTSYYYYFYGMQVEAAGCVAAARKAVTVKRPVITPNANVLSSNFTAGNQWYHDDVAISGATAQTYTAKESGRYKLQVTLNSGCTDTSATYVDIMHPATSSGNDIGLLEYPVPANTVLNILFTAKASSNLSILLINSAGKITYTSKSSVAAGNFSTTLNVSGQPPGVYIVKLVLGQKVYANKVIIEQ